MSRKWVAPKCKYEMKGDYVQTDGTYREKISGTSMGGIMGVSPYATPFTTTAKLLGLWNEDISDKPAVKTGSLLEERIIEYASKHYPDVGEFFKAEDIFAKREGDHASWQSDFEDDVFAGHVDGIITKDGVDYILECKTARDPSAWLEGPPNHYYWQVCLYNHFITKQDKAYFVLGVVDTETYSNPNSWVANKNNCYLFEVKINQKAVSDVINNIRRIYSESVGKGLTLKIQEGNELDEELKTHLTDISGTTDELNDLISEYATVHKFNQQKLEEIKDSTKREDTLKDRIKDIMVSWNLQSARNVQIKTQKRKSFDFVKADMDGFDYSKYLKTTEVNVFNYKEE